jgi:hypothetical protein
VAELRCEVSGPLDLGVLDAVLRLELAVRRAGGRLELTADRDVTGLLSACGLTGVVEPGRQPEAGEDAGRERRAVQEVVHVRHRAP